MNRYRFTTEEGLLVANAFGVIDEYPAQVARVPAKSR
jgi:hypothetical protein